MDANVAIVAVLVCTLLAVIGVLTVLYVQLAQRKHAGSEDRQDRQDRQDRPPAWSATSYLPPPALNVNVANQQPRAPDRPYVPYRSPNAEFHQVGFAYRVDMRVPLYGRPAPRNPSRWQYFVRTSDADVRIGVVVKGRFSLDDVGAEELQTGDEISVPELADTPLKATIYDTRAGF